jgi:hypothetical protein
MIVKKNENLTVLRRPQIFYKLYIRFYNLYIEIFRILKLHCDTTFIHNKILSYSQTSKKILECNLNIYLDRILFNPCFTNIKSYFILHLII